MKAWYDDIDAATLQRIKTYSAFNDPESKNLMVQTMYEYRQEEITELEKENKALGERCLQLQKDKGKLTDENNELKAQIEKMKCCANCDFIFRDGNCYYDKECKNKDHWKLRR